MRSRSGVAVGEEVGADLGVGLHDLALLGGEASGLVEDVVGDADLADVVEDGGVADELGVGG
jgi:hypothetical protein